MPNRLLIGLLLAGCATVSGNVPDASEFSSVGRGRVKQMLRAVSKDVKENYYDQGFHGIDWDAAVALTEEKIDAAASMSMAFSHVAALLDSLGDSHTYFLPPARRVHVDYGFRAAIVGDRCFIVHVRPESDAEQKGLQPGDELFAINNFKVDRESLPKIEFVYYVLRPQAGLRLDLKQPDGEPRQIDVMARTKLSTSGGANGAVDLWEMVRALENEAQLNRTHIVSIGKNVTVVKIRGFSDVDEDVLERALKAARQRRSLVLDLRGNPGGSVENLRTLASMLFGRKVRIGELVYRDKSEPLETEARDDAFTGELVVLVDSASASASEVLARLVQIEKRGTVVGDATRGHVMQSMYIDHALPVRSNSAVPYGVSITNADLIMTDGKSLERRGVQPDVRMTPAVDDLVGGLDPVLAHAIEMLGAKVTPEAAGEMFPFEWPEP